MSSAFKTVSNAASGVQDTLFGGNKQAGYQNNQPISATDSANLNDISQKLQQLYGQQGSGGANGALNDTFRQHLMDFLTQSSQGTNPSPEQMAQAQNFVDQTFTNPTQNALNQYQSNYASSANAQAAALGRNPNADIATQQAIYGEGQRNTMNLMANRGSQIAQTAQGLNQQNFSRQAQGLQAGMVGGNFLNNLTQQAFSNQLGLLNQRSGLLNFNQNDRNQNRTYNNPSINPGFLSTANSDFGQIQKIGNGAQSFGDSGGVNGLGNQFAGFLGGA